MCLALDAKFRIVGPSGERLVSAEEFFLGYMTTAVGPQELLTEVRVPVLPSGTGSAYAKLQRIEGGFAIVGVAAILKVRSSLCQEIALGIGGGGPIPFRLKDVESWCQGRKVDEQFIAEVAEAAYAASSEPTSELHADAAYKRDMVRVFTRRALRTALQRVSI